MTSIQDSFKFHVGGALVLVSSPATIPVSENKRLRVPLCLSKQRRSRSRPVSAPAKGAQVGDPIDLETGYAAAVSAAPLLNPQIRAGSPNYRSVGAGGFAFTGTLPDA